MACSECGSDRDNTVQNPLDCGNQFMQCSSPCGVRPGNTPQCESLPSQIENFTLQFFGEVFKTEVDGKVVWSLPCSLDTGLPANPRGSGEGLACYFLRLFRDGIAGLQGPTGPAGTPGLDGNNAYSVTAQTITVPPSGNPMIQFLIVPNPSILPGLSIFIQGAGWFDVNDVQPGGVVVATLIAPLVAAGTVIAPGSIVVPGSIGAQGPTGAPGPQGPQGPAGLNLTSSYGTWSALNTDGTFKPGLAVWPLSVSNVLSAVDFTSAPFAVTLPAAGVYAVRATVPLVALPGISTSDYIQTQLFNQTTGTPVYDSEQFVNSLISGQFSNVILHSLVQTTGASQVISVRASISNAVSYGYVDYQVATISWFRIA